MIRLKEGTRLEVERMAKLITSLKQLATLLMPGWCRTWTRLEMSTHMTRVAWLWYDNSVDGDMVVLVWRKKRIRKPDLLAILIVTRKSSPPHS